MLTQCHWEQSVLGGEGGFFTIFAQSLQTENVTNLSETFVAEHMNTCRAKLTLALV